jgi:hypothetical protein
MPSTLHRGGLIVLPALLVLGACGTELGAPDAEEQQVNLDVAYYAADVTSDDVTLMTTEADRTMLPTFRTQDGCERLGSFTIRCPQRHFGDNITFTREVTFLDSLESEMEYFHRDSTESIHIVTSLEGSRARDNLTVTISRDRDMTVSGLFGSETQRTWNGTGSAATNRTRVSDENGDREYDMTSTSTILNVVHAVPRPGTWPLSGTITRNVTVVIISGEDTRTRTRTAVIEFNGTQFATITINGEIFTFDLETRTVVRDDEG